MLRNIIATLFIFFSITSTLSEFTLSYPNVAGENVTEFVSSISFLLPFVQAMAFLSGIYIIFFTSSVRVKAENTSFIVNHEERNAESITKEIEEQESKLLSETTEIIYQKLAGIKESSAKSEQALWAICNEFNLSQGLVYKHTGDNLELTASYAFMGDVDTIDKIEIGVGVTGQAAKNGEPVYLEEVPKGYLKVVSGLGEAYPDYILITPIKNEKSLIGMIELAGMGKLTTKEIEVINQLIHNTFTKLLSK